MRSKSLSLILAVSSTAMVLAAGCGSDSTPGGTAGHGGAGSTGTAGATAGTTGAAGATAGTTGTAGATAGSTGTAGAGGAGGGTAGAGGATAGTGGAAAGAGGGAGGPVNPIPIVTIPTAIEVPAGNVVKFRVHATGTQTYTCQAMTPATDGGASDGGADAGATTYAWSAASVPAADLSDENNVKVGMHYAGPTWMSTDGSDVVGVKEAASPGTTATDIPWLRLKAASHMGAGVMADVTYVQRVNTKGGVAPATGCDAAHVDMKTSVAYTADYWFYKSSGDAGVTADWPFTALGTLDPSIALNGPVLKLKLHALGAQIYTCTGTTTGGADAGADAGAATTTYAFVLKQPDAKLYDDTNTQQATHGLGPSWTHKDGSVITGTKLAAFNSPLTDAIPWLKLQVTAHSGATGVFTDVTYVQRLNTTKGVAPATGCDAAHANMDTSVAYTADYYFYTGAVVVPDAGTD
jgi:hypothetical protein